MRSLLARLLPSLRAGVIRWGFGFHRSFRQTVRLCTVRVLIVRRETTKIKDETSVNAFFGSCGRAGLWEPAVDLSVCTTPVKQNPKNQISHPDGRIWNFQSKELKWKSGIPELNESDESDETDESDSMKFKLRQSSKGSLVDLC